MRRTDLTALVDAAVEAVVTTRRSLPRATTVQEDTATVIGFLRGLPVEQRMEAMGMGRVKGWHADGEPIFVEQRVLDDAERAIDKAGTGG